VHVVDVVVTHRCLHDVAGTKKNPSHVEGSPH